VDAAAEGGVEIKDLLEGGLIHEVDLVEKELTLVAGELESPVEGFFGRVAEVVDNDEALAEGEELDDGVGTDEAGAAGDEDGVIFGMRVGHGV